MRPALYVHVPYCRLRCTYCNFYFELGHAGAGLIEAYRRELDLRRDDLPAAPLPAVYLGGGTPSWLPGELLDALLALLEPFTGPDTEFSIECNPEDLDSALLERLRARAVNRVSLGVQSLNDLELKRCARRHDAAGARRAMERLAGSGIAWSADLILGLPQQRSESFERSLEEVLGFGPGHLSLYTLELDPPVPLTRVFARHPEWDPGDELRAELYLWAHERLEAEGFRHYELSNWARPGRECRYNLQVWQGGEYMGLGPSAHSHLAGRRSSWAPDLDAWMGSLGSGRLPQAVEDPRGAEEQRLEELLLGLRLAEGLPADSILLQPAQPLLAALEDEGWLLEADGRCRLSPSGWLRLDGILARLTT